MAESQNVEYKESWRDEYLRWICGFANAQGGKIFIGIDDNGNVKGVANSKRLLEDIPNKVKNTLGIVVDVNLHTDSAGDYIEIAVEPQPYPISYYGEYHYRSGSTKQQLTGQQLNQFLMKKTGTTWDSIPLSVEAADLRFDSFDIFRDRAVKSSRMSAENVNIDNVQLLDSLNLLEGSNLKRAGVLLFHHNPEKWIPGCYVKIGYFSSDTEIVYQDELHGSLLNQAEKAIDLIYTKYLKGIISYDGITRVETYPYPREAVREAVLNAIAHKNYAALIPIQIKVYDDKLIISNDCVFPEDWTLEDFLGKHRSRPYNPLIANTFYRAGYVESWGRGILKINEACRKSGNKEPQFILKKDELTIIFEAKQNSVAASKESNMTEMTELTELSVKLTEVQSKIQSFDSKLLSDNDKKKISAILEYLKTEDSINGSTVKKLLSCSDSTARRILAKAADFGILIGEGKTNDKKYHVQYL